MLQYKDLLLKAYLKNLSMCKMDHSQQCWKSCLSPWREKWIIPWRMWWVTLGPTTYKPRGLEWVTTSRTPTFLLLQDSGIWPTSSTLQGFCKEETVELYEFSTIKNIKKRWGSTTPFFIRILKRKKNLISLPKLPQGWVAKHLSGMHKALVQLTPSHKRQRQKQRQHNFLS